MPECLQQYLRSLFCHDITNFNATYSEMFGVNTFVDFLFSFIGRENKQAAEEISPFPSLKLTKTKYFENSTRHFNRPRDDSKRYAVTKVFFAIKGRTDIT